MRKIRLVMSLLIPLLVLVATATSPTVFAVNTHFMSHMSTDEEVPTPIMVEEGEQGVTQFRLSKDGTSLSYKLRASNIENVTQAHIHVGQPGVAGPVVAFLFGRLKPNACTVRQNSIHCEGTVIQSDLIGPLAGQPLSALVTQMEAGNTYVNVHTTVNPAGEIRGQVED